VDPKLVMAVFKKDRRRRLLARLEPQIREALQARGISPKRPLSADQSREALAICKGIVEDEETRIDAGAARIERWRRAREQFTKHWHGGRGHAPVVMPRRCDGRQRQPRCAARRTSRSSAASGDSGGSEPPAVHARAREASLEDHALAWWLAAEVTQCVGADELTFELFEALFDDFEIEGLFDDLDPPRALRSVKMPDAADCIKALTFGALPEELQASFLASLDAEAGGGWS
jgi:hypothetical protein